MLVSTQPSLMSTCIDWFNFKVLDPVHMKTNHFNFIVGYYNSLDGPITNIWTIDFLKTFFIQSLPISELMIALALERLGRGRSTFIFLIVLIKY